MKENKVWSAIINFSWFVNLKGINLEINLILIIFSGFFLFCIKIMNAWLSSWIFPNYFAKLLNRISHHLYQQLKKNCRIVCCKPIKCLFWCNIIFFLPLKQFQTSNQGKFNARSYKLYSLLAFSATTYPSVKAISWSLSNPSVLTASSERTSVPFFVML